jgi:hypothetical protein
MSSILTFSQFYFGHTITSTNASLDFSEGGPELQADLNPGDYSLTEFLVEIKRAMEAIGALTYTVSVDRATRLITIAGSGTFSLLAGSGTRIGTGVWGLAGFAATDLTGTNTYTGGLASGSIWRPQCKLANYIAPEDNLTQIDAVVNESASGNIQVVLFGQQRFIEMRAPVITEKAIKSGTLVEAQSGAIANARAFLEYATTKAKFEFMPDRDTPNTFYKVLLEQTAKSRNGTAYQLERYEDAFGVFDTGNLVLRVVN